MPSVASAVFRTLQRSGSLLDRVVNGSPIGDPKFEGDPYSLYARLLAKGPLVRSYLMGGWSLLSFQAVHEALRDPSFSSDVVQNPMVNRGYQFATRLEDARHLDRMENDSPQFRRFVARFITWVAAMP